MSSKPGRGCGEEGGYLSGPAEIMVAKTLTVPPYLVPKGNLTEFCFSLITSRNSYVPTIVFANLVVLDTVGASFV